MCHWDLVLADVTLRARCPDVTFPIAAMLLSRTVTDTDTVILILHNLLFINYIIIIILSYDMIYY